MIKEVAESIIAKYEADVDLKSGLAGGLWFQQAQKENKSPYGVFYLTGITQEEVMGDATDNIYEVSVQFNLFSVATDGGHEIADMVKLLTDCYDWQTLTITGYNLVKMQRENILPLGYRDGVWQSTVNYALGIQAE